MVGVDYVFHLAALVSVPESMSLHAETVEINVQGLLNVLAAAKKHGVKKTLFRQLGGRLRGKPGAAQGRDDDARSAQPVWDHQTRR